VVVDSSMESMIVSIDCVHRPGSTTQLRRLQDVDVTPLHVFRYSELQWVSTAFQFEYYDKKGDAYRKCSEMDVGSLSSMLYTLENLRKHGGEE
jgi:hypothetical protein